MHSCSVSNGQQQQKLVVGQSQSDRTSKRCTESKAAKDLAQNYNQSGKIVHGVNMSATPLQNSHLFFLCKQSTGDTEHSSVQVEDRNPSLIASNFSDKKDSEKVTRSTKFKNSHPQVRQFTLGSPNESFINKRRQSQMKELEFDKHKDEVLKTQQTSSFGTSSGPNEQLGLTQSSKEEQLQPPLQREVSTQQSSTQNPGLGIDRQTSILSISSPSNPLFSTLGKSKRSLSPCQGKDCSNVARNRDEEEEQQTLYSGFLTSSHSNQTNELRVAEPTKNQQEFQQANNYKPSFNDLSEDVSEGIPSLSKTNGSPTLQFGSQLKLSELGHSTMSGSCSAFYKQFSDFRRTCSQEEANEFHLLDEQILGNSELFEELKKKRGTIVPQDKKTISDTINDYTLGQQLLKNKEKDSHNRTKRSQMDGFSYLDRELLSPSSELKSMQKSSNSDLKLKKQELSNITFEENDVASTKQANPFNQSVHKSAQNPEEFFSSPSQISPEFLIVQSSPRSEEKKVISCQTKPKWNVQQLSDLQVVYEQRTSGELSSAVRSEDCSPLDNSPKRSNPPEQFRSLLLGQLKHQNSQKKEIAKKQLQIIEESPVETIETSDQLNQSVLHADTVINLDEDLKGQGMRMRLMSLKNENKIQSDLSVSDDNQKSKGNSQNPATNAMTPLINGQKNSQLFFNNYSLASLSGGKSLRKNSIRSISEGFSDVAVNENLSEKQAHQNLFQLFEIQKENRVPKLKTSIQQSRTLKSADTKSLKSSCKSKNSSPKDSKFSQHNPINYLRQLSSQDTEKEQSSICDRRLSKFIHFDSGRQRFIPENRRTGLRSVSSVELNTFKMANTNRGTENFESNLEFIMQPCQRSISGERRNAMVDAARSPIYATYNVKRAHSLKRNSSQRFPFHRLSPGDKNAEFPTGFNFHERRNSINKLEQYQIIKRRQSLQNTNSRENDKDSVSQRSQPLQKPEEIFLKYKDFNFPAFKVSDYKETTLRIIQTISLTNDIPRGSPIRENQMIDFKFKKRGYTKLLLFDLDETLIHTKRDAEDEIDIDCLIRIYGENFTELVPDELVQMTPPYEDESFITEGIFIRPHLQECLRAVNHDYEVGIFTAGDEWYANPIIDKIDPTRTLVQHRYFRQHTQPVSYNGETMFVKDLSIFRGIDISNILLVDNAPKSFMRNFMNGIPIIDFYGNKDDKELIKVMKYVHDLSRFKNVMLANEHMLRLDELSRSAIDKFIQYYELEELSESDENDFDEDGRSIQNGFFSNSGLVLRKDEEINSLEDFEGEIKLNESIEEEQDISNQICPKSPASIRSRQNGCFNLQLNPLPKAMEYEQISKNDEGNIGGTLCHIDELDLDLGHDEFCNQTEISWSPENTKSGAQTVTNCKQQSPNPECSEQFDNFTNLQAIQKVQSLQVPQFSKVRERGEDKHEIDVNAPNKAVDRKPRNVDATSSYFKAIKKHKLSCASSQQHTPLSMLDSMSIVDKSTLNNCKQINQNLSLQPFKKLSQQKDKCPLPLGPQLKLQKHQYSGDQAQFDKTCDPIQESSTLQPQTCVKKQGSTFFTSNQLSGAHTQAHAESNRCLSQTNMPDDIQSVINPPHWSIRKQRLMTKQNLKHSPNLATNIDYHLDEIASTFQSCRIAKEKKKKKRKHSMSRKEGEKKSKTLIDVIFKDNPQNAAYITSSMGIKKHDLATNNGGSPIQKPQIRESNLLVDKSWTEPKRLDKKRSQATTTNQRVTNDGVSANGEGEINIEGVLQHHQIRLLQQAQKNSDRSVNTEIQNIGQNIGQGLLSSQSKQEKQPLPIQQTHLTPILSKAESQVLKHGRPVHNSIKISNLSSCRRSEAQPQ